jgi:hypothetical protein
MESKSLLRSKYAFMLGKYPGIVACFACVTRTAIELSKYFYLEYSERVPGVQIVAVKS